MNLTLAIPVWNDAPALTRLLGQIAARGWLGSVIAQVLVHDDGSEPALDLAPPALPPDALRLIRAPETGGPGRGRNRLLEAVTTDHVLFFDADDLLGAELPGLIADLEGRDFDFCLFKHCDSRPAEAGLLGQTAHDEAIWQEAGLAYGRLSRADPGQAAILARTANFPWNKIYRTGFLRDNAIGCAPILVHEDVELHWMSFLRAREILVSDRLAAIHYVTGDGDRLTNRTGAERLAVFPSLARLAVALEAPDHAALRVAFFRFTAGLLDWIRGNLRPDLHDRLTAESRAFLATHLDAGTLAAIAAQAPDRAAGLRALRDDGAAS